MRGKAEQIKDKINILKWEKKDIQLDLIKKVDFITFSLVQCIVGLVKVKKKQESILKDRKNLKPNCKNKALAKNFFV